MNVNKLIMKRIFQLTGILFVASILFEICELFDSKEDCEVFAVKYSVLADFF